MSERDAKSCAASQRKHSQAASVPMPTAAQTASSKYIQYSQATDLRPAPPGCCTCVSKQVYFRKAATGACEHRLQTRLKVGFGTFKSFHVA
jgi:hypothetical protein